LISAGRKKRKKKQPIEKKKGGEGADIQSPSNSFPDEEEGGGRKIDCSVVRLQRKRRGGENTKLANALISVKEPLHAGNQEKKKGRSAFLRLSASWEGGGEKRD